MIDHVPNVVWRVDIATQRAVRDSLVQAAPALRGIMAAGNWWGSVGVIWVAALLWLGGRMVRRRAAALIGLRGAEGLVIASALSGIIKGLAGRARPFVTSGEPWHWTFNRGWSDAQFFSMPSGHTTATAAFAVGVLVAMHGWMRWARVGLAAALLAGTAVVAFARVYSDQHWLTDVIAGMLLGTLTSLTLARVHARRSPNAYDRLMLGRVATTP